MNAAAAALVVLNGRQAFDPRASLFAHNEQGFWYDPSDYSTLFQDSAGITPVTAVEQAVGLILDKSKGLVLGPELVTNGDFSSGTTGWSAVSGGSISVSGGVATFSSSPTLQQTAEQVITTVANRWYQFTVDVISLSAGSQSFSVGTSSGGNQLFSSFSSTLGKRTGYFLATSTTTYVGWFCGAASRSANIDNISVRELAGNHAIQPSAASRPILRSRYNLLTYSEDFSNAAWTKRGTFTVTANDAIAPDGTLTADKVTGLDTGGNDMFNADYQTVVIAPAGASYAPSIWVKRISTSGVFFVGNPINTAQGQWNVDLSQLPDAWTRITATTTGVTVVNPFVTSASGTGGIQLRGVSGGPLSMHIWGADLRSANDTYLPYQRIAAATDYDTVGFPVYLAFDGSDDSLYTGGNVDFSATDKMTVFAGVTKLSDGPAGTYGCIAELGTDINSVNGTWALFGPAAAPGGTPDFGMSSRGTLTANAIASSNAAPITRVMTGEGQIGGLPFVTLRLDGTQAASGVNSQGTGNYGNYPLYIGRRNNATLPFNGRLYQLIGRGAATSAALIQQAERWVAGKQGRAL